MTAITSALRSWTTLPMGRAVRIALALTGMVTSTLILMLAAVIETGSWMIVILGISLAVASVSAARVPSATRLVATAAVLLAVPLALRML